MNGSANPLLRQVKTGRWTPDELLEAYRFIRDEDPRVKEHLQEFNKPKSAPLIALVETVAQAKTLQAEAGKIIGLSTGYKAIDKLTSGIGPSEMIVIFGDTSHGKSQLAQNISLNVAQAGTPVLFVGLEMSNAENTARFMNMAGDGAADLPILYPANMDLGYRDIDNLVESAKKEGIGLVVIDHLHMFARDVANLANELSLICHELKRVARKYELPMIVISHISRGAAGGPPELKDLKGSSSIEQDCDIALAVWRDMNLEEHLQSLHIVNRKNRLRGRKHTRAELSILPNARLVETVSVFPSAR